MSGNFAYMASIYVIRDLLHTANLRHGTDGFTSPPKEGVLRIFSPLKFRRLRPSLNPRTWVLRAAPTPRPQKPLYILYIYIYLFIYLFKKWPRGLRRRSAAYRLLRRWVRIPPKSWISVSYECRVFFQVEISATG